MKPWLFVGAKVVCIRAIRAGGYSTVIPGHIQPEDTAMSIAVDARLLSFVQRIERLDGERRAISADIAEVKKELKSAGYDLKTVNEILKLRKLDDPERQEREAMIDTYKAALGMIADRPLGQSAIARSTSTEGGGERGEGGEGESASAPTSVIRAVKSFVDGIPEGSSVTVTSGGKSATITKDEDGKMTASRDDTPPPDKITASVEAVRQSMRAGAAG